MATIASFTAITGAVVSDSASIPVSTNLSPVGRRIEMSELWKYALGTTGTSRAFFGAAATAQPAGSAQSAYTLTMASVAATTVGAAVTTTAATNSSPYGFATAAQADDLVARVNELRADVVALRARVAEARADVTGLGALLAAVRSALVTLGLIKGAA